MAERRRTPRSYFGISATPQPGLQEPALSPGMKQRFSDAGLEAFTPYIDPWQTVARSQDYRGMENQFKVQDAEERFIQRLQQDPTSATTGLQKFLAEDPRLIASPMFRAYAVTQDRLSREQKPKTNPYALDAAEAGKEFLSAYNKDIASGVPELDAFAAHRTRLAEAKKKSPEDERLTLSGTPKEEFDNLMAEYVRSQDEEPTPEEKLAFLPPGRKEYTEAEWADAYPKAKAAKQQEAIRKIERFQQVYGDFYKMPGNARRTASDGHLSPSAAAQPIVPQSASAAIPDPNTEVSLDQDQTPTETVTEIQEQPISQADLKRIDEVSPTTPAKSQYQGFKGLSRDEKLEPTGPEKFIKEMTPFFTQLTNIALNPADKMSDVFWAPKGTKMAMLFEPPPTQEHSEARWDDSKKSVKDFLVDLEGNKEGALELARAIVAGARLPADEFFEAGKFPKESSLPAETRIDATLAALSGLKNKHKMPAGPAFRDMNGPVTWDKVIRSAAQDLLEENGELTVKRDGQATAPSAPKKPSIIAIREKK